MASTTIPTRRRGEQRSPPTWVKPQLASLVKKAPEGTDWLHEIKLDGYRMHARLVEVSYIEWTPDGLLRHVVYLGEREDKPAIDVRRDRP